MPAAFLGVAYLAISLALAASRARWSLALLWVLASGLLLGGGLVALLRAGIAENPAPLVALAVACAIAPLVPYLAGPARYALALAIPAAAIGGGFLLKDDPESRNGAARATFRSALYPLSLERIALPDPLPAADGGALAPLPGGLLLAQGDGRFRWLAGEGSLREYAVHMTTIPDPMDRAAYLADFPGSGKPPRLRLTDALFSPGDAPARLYAAHQSWDSARACYTMNLSAIGIAWDSRGFPEPSGPWNTLFVSEPCQKAEGSFDDSETGGQLAWTGEDRVLMTFGDLGFAGLDDTVPYSQDPQSNSYGKVLEIDVGTGAASVYSLGHRNPQGLVVAQDGRIWLSEHGPQGGDEINLLRRGANYGWPHATYGTQYGATTWPLNETPSNHGSYAEPALSFVPSVATSALIEIIGPHFANWRNDLLLGTLRTESLFRIRLRGDDVIYAEQIPVGERVRDLAVLDDGRVVAWIDRGLLVEVSVSPTDSAFDRYCASCHAPQFGVAAGPQLNDVLGRKIAAVPGFPYSGALAGLAGTWTDERLRAFVADPAGVAPGTSMIDPEIPGDEIDALLRELGG